MYTVPSSRDNETISVPTSLRDSLSCLDVVWADMFETEDINHDRVRQQQIDFLRGAPPRWQNFYTSVNQPTVVPLVKRDGFNDLIQLVEIRKRKGALITDAPLRYQSGSGGSTLAMQMLWHFRKDLRCARAIDSDLNTKLSDLSKQVLDLFLLSNEEHANQDRRTVLLLLDTREKTDNYVPIKNVLCNKLIEEIHKRGINTDTPVVIILNCIPTDFTLTDTMIIPPNLSEETTKQLKEKVLQQIRLQGKSQRKVTTINLHHKDSSGSTLALEVLSDLSKEFTCETLREPFNTDIAENKVFTFEIQNMANGLLRIHKTHQKTVLLLLDNKDDKSLHYLLKTLEFKLTHADHPGFIIINAVCKSAVRVPDVVKLKLELLPDEKKRFDQKSLEVKKEYKKMSQKLHSFNIMQRGFQREDAEKMIREEMANHIKKDPKSKGTRLFSFLALINSYVPGSHLSKLLCKRFIGKSEWPIDDGKPSLEMILKPFENLIVSFSDGEQKADCIRLAHPMIADACLKLFTEHNVKRSDVALDFLDSMVRSNKISYEQICKSMLVTRLEGLTGKEMFSKLILDILDEGENNTKQCIDLLESASSLFSTNPFYPQALARLYYIKVKEENKFEMAEKSAKEAIDRDQEKSHIKDTLGQVRKSHLQRYFKNPNRDIKVCLDIAKSAIDAFHDEAKTAEFESADTRFSNRGLFGFLQVCNVSCVMNLKEALEQEYKGDLRGDIESRYDFFERYLVYSRPTPKQEEPAYFSEDVEECYIHFFKQGEQTGKMTLNEKKMKSFAGLLHFLQSDINVLEKNWNAIANPQSDNETQMVHYTLANIILSQFDKPCENLQDLQARLQELWKTEENHRSPEFYLSILLLFWPDEAQTVNQDSPNLENCVQYMSQSYERTYQKYLYGRYLVPLFFLGKGSGLQKLVHKKLFKTDLELLTNGDENVEVSCLQRINGEVKKHQVFAVRDGQQIQVSLYKRASVYRDGEVSFYIGFTIKGPVAYKIRYEENSK
ncbi:Sterile alpha motif domain-containing protein 9 [Triplophysa tibetana]|uniref:Sterile alpha motif domain-containing protein 9 n=1 Tax=Triplophysa tibetana TaxID=1572043 RepID=A0A5A9PV97_9TELE|nr:Sterile alpha motif domain-containing protein 9 [Triplophysa tibetana]